MQGIFNVPKSYSPCTSFCFSLFHSAFWLKGLSMLLSIYQAWVNHCFLIRPREYPLQMFLHSPSEGPQMASTSLKNSEHLHICPLMDLCQTFSGTGTQISSPQQTSGFLSRMAGSQDIFSLNLTK